MSRRRTATHFTRTTSGTLAHIRIHGELHRKHFPTGTDKATMLAWLVKTEIRYRGTRAKRTGKFDDDARAYLQAVKAMPTYAQRKQHIEEWIAVFGSRRRADITADEIRAQLHTWRTVPRKVKQRAKHGQERFKVVTLSAAAVNKRRTALMHLHSVLDGKAEPNPVKDVPRFAEPTPAPKGIPYAIIRQIFAKMPPSKSKAWLMVMAYTGIPPEVLRSVTADDVDLDGRTVALVGRKKGKGTQGRIQPLSAEGIDAFKMMIREDAFGTITNTVLRRAFRRACKAAIGRTDLTPYDLRHSFGTEVYRSSGDIRATQVLMGHSTPQLTHRYTLAAVDPRVKDALEKFGR